MKHGTHIAKPAARQARQAGTSRSSAARAEKAEERSASTYQQVNTSTNSRRRCKSILRWLVRCKWYANKGTYYIGDFNVILPVIVGGLSGVWTGISVYILIQFTASVLGYIDFTRLRRIQYEEALNTKANPFLLEEIRRKRR